MTIEYMSARALVPSKNAHLYLYAEDLRGKRTVVEIDVCAPRESHIRDGGESEDKATLYFSGRKKRLILNKTNAKLLYRVLGAPHTKWAGQSIEIFPAVVTTKDGPTPAIRMADPKNHAVNSLRKGERDTTAGGA